MFICLVYFYIKENIFINEKLKNLEYELNELTDFYASLEKKITIKYNDIKNISIEYINELIDGNRFKELILLYDNDELLSLLEITPEIYDKILYNRI